MTNSKLATPPTLLGAQRPRIEHLPDAVATPTAERAVELAHLVGLHLDPWEEYVLRCSLGERAGRTWAALEVACLAPRQNGKNEILIARELAGLFLLKERLIIHTAHEAATSRETHQRVAELIRGVPKLSRRVKNIPTANGKEAVLLKDGARCLFRTRTRTALRGFAAVDLLVMDEAMEIHEHAHGSGFFITAANPNPQVWYTASAVDQWNHQDGVVLARIRERGIAGSDPRLAYFEWSCPGEHPDDLSEELVSDPQAWAQANPGLGIRISQERIQDEHNKMDPHTFAVERLGVGDWPRTDDHADEVFDRERWAACADRATKPGTPLYLAFDMPRDRSSISIAVVAQRPDGLFHGEIVERKRRSGDEAERIAQIAKDHDVADVICDEGGPARSLTGPLERLGVQVVSTSAREYTQACGLFYDAVEQERFRFHPDTPGLTAAVRGAAKRNLGDAWAWSRKHAAVDISPLVAVSLALWGAYETDAPPEPLVAIR